MNDNYLSKSKENFQPQVSERFPSFKKEPRELALSPTGLFRQDNLHPKSVLMDMQSVTNQNKKLKVEMQHMEEKLQNKEHEIINLRYQLEVKDSIDVPRVPENGQVLTQRNTNRSPASGEHNENKNSKFFRRSDSDIERALEEENRYLHKEVKKLQAKLINSEEEKKTLKKELNKSRDNILKDHSYRLSIIEDERDELEKTNQTLKLELERLNEEISSLTEERLDMTRRYEDLKSCYDVLETKTSTKFSDYSLASTPHSDAAKSGKDTPFSNRLYELADKMRREDSLSSIKASADLNDLNLADCRKLLAEIMDIYKIKSTSEIIASIHKTEKVIQAIPRLRKLISDISALVLPKVGGEKDTDQIELIIPTIKKCLKDLDELEALKVMQKKLVEMLELGEEATNYDILKKVSQLICSGYQYNEMKSHRVTKDSSEKTLVESFIKVFDAKPDVHLFKQINTQLEELKYFTNLVKQRLGLNFSLKSETCLKHVIKLVENSAKDREAADIALKLQKRLNCKLETVPTKIEELITERFKYNPFNSDGRV